MIRIYHNNHCSKSRATLALLKERHLDVEVINYLDTPPDEKELAALLKQLGMTARELLRTGEPEYQSLGLADPALEDLLDRHDGAAPEADRAPDRGHQRQGIDRPPTRSGPGDTLNPWRPRDLSQSLLAGSGRISQDPAKTHRHPSTPGSVRGVPTVGPDRVSR